MDYVTIIIFLFGLILSAIYFYIRKSSKYFAKHGIPFIKPTFPYGSFKGLMETESILTAVQRYYNELKGRGPLGGLFFLVSPGIIITDLDLIKKVLIKDFSSFEDRGGYYNKDADPLSAHLFSLDSEEWRKLRPKLSPTFTSGKMKFMYPTIVEVAERFRSVLKDTVGKDGKILEMRDVLARFTVDVIGTCAFGIECNSLTDPNAKFLRMGRRILSDPRYSTFIAVIIETYPNICRKLGVKVNQDDVSDFFMNIVKETVAYREANNVRRNDFMDILIGLKNEKYIDANGKLNVGQITLNEIAGQVFLFFLAGFETSSTAMSWSLYELAINKDIQNRAREELNEILKKYDGKITYEAMMDMHYIDQILNESLRKYPPLSILFRSSISDYYVPEIDYTIPKGMRIWIPVHALQNDPEYFPNPDSFDPDRFSPEAMKEQKPMTFLPFGDGPRNCIGLRFGMMQARIGLATMLLNFEFSVCSETTIPMELAPKEFITTPLHGIKLNVRPIE